MTIIVGLRDCTSFVWKIGPYTSYHSLRCEEKVYMHWYIVYKGKPTKGSLRENLERAGVTYFIPTQNVEHLDGDRMEEKEEAVLNNLIFVQTYEDIRVLTKEVDGLKSPYLNHATGMPATVTDAELYRFKRVLEARSLHAHFLPDVFQRFESCPKVRVKAGEFMGMEGRVFRIRHDRKLVIQLENMAIAVSGIHHSLLEIVDDQE